MLRALKVKLVVTSLAVAVGVTGSASSALGQEHAGHHAANKVVVDADILSAFVNKPCENFQLARKHFLSGNNKKAASSLRTALAFLRLEAARADATSQVAIEKSVNDLKLLASAVERGEVQAYSELQRAFVEAHVALASHHCVQSDTCCCQLEKDGADSDVTCVCRELNAATNRWQRIQQLTSARHAPPKITALFLEAKPKLSNPTNWALQVDLTCGLHLRLKTTRMNNCNGASAVLNCTG
tara:strand:+ start:1969 stop:2691 length:723 start_codon:yes stop_codon:yes gene_type:complete